MAIKRGSTPIYTFEVEGKSFKRCKVFVTFEQNGTLVTKTNDDIEITNLTDENGNERSTINVPLTQEDTLGFDTGSVQVQVRWIDHLKQAGATDMQTINLESVLLEEVIRYE